MELVQKVDIINYTQKRVENNMKKIIIASGGLDSTTLLYDLLKTNPKKDVIALSFDYGSNHARKELTAINKTCKKLGVKHHVINLKKVFKDFKSSLLGGEIPEGHYKEDNMKSTVVPFRNGILLSIAVGYAESVDADCVYYGAHAGDHTIYPDTTIEFISAMNNAAHTGTWEGIKILAPYANLTKSDILDIGLKLGVDYSLTWTCYKGQRLPCGKCGACIERNEAFYNKHKIDPLYKNINKWIEDVARL